MKTVGQQKDISTLSLAGMLVTLGIVFGDIGTSPLYTISSIVNNGAVFNELLIYGSLSCVFWTLTLQTTIKYVLITLTADNRGEGGIFALFALIRKKTAWAAILTMVGGGALLADGVITPAITVTSSIEGLRIFNSHIPVIPIVLLILGILFFAQQFGTNFMGVVFGPAMVIWFLMLGILGIAQLVHFPDIFRALNPVFAVRFLTHYPGGFILLGAVFLCTTGAEAMYSDLGHCGRSNIRFTWIFVKTTLLLNYFGQGAWLMMHHTPGMRVKPFFDIMPGWFLLPGIIISTSASIIASQALISGSYTLIGEAVSLNFWPKIRILNPTSIRGQIYIPFVNWSLWIMCSAVVLFFRESANMEAAYGLAITITMIMTTVLLSHYLIRSGLHPGFSYALLVFYLAIEGSFLAANLNKFRYGGWFTLLLASIYFIIMFGWYFGRKIKNRRITFSNISGYTSQLAELRDDKTVPKIATNLVYLIKANRQDQVESKVIFSILNKFPKRADTYWLLHIDRVNEPNTLEYAVNQIIPGVLIRIDFRIGFKRGTTINLYFREVLDDLIKSGEVRLESGYDSLKRYNVPADFMFVVLERIMSKDIRLSKTERFIILLHGLLQKIGIPDVRSFQLDITNTIVEKIPIVVRQSVRRRIKPVLRP